VQRSRLASFQRGEQTDSIMIGPVPSVPGGLVFTFSAIGDTLNCEWAAQDRQPVFTVIFFSAFCASAVFGNVTISTPLLKLASTLSRSTPSGT
jgi:hypothetical protein